jgi:hypothetical protein
VTALMTRDEIAAARNAARERYEARRNVYRSYSERERRAAWLEERELPSCGIYDPEFRDPETPAEWLDDVVLQWGGTMRALAEAPVMVAVAEAARESAAAAVKALGAARELAPAAQWSVFQNIRSWRSQDESGRLGTVRLTAALLDGWSRLKLPEEDPGLERKPRRRNRPWEVVETQEMAS